MTLSMGFPEAQKAVASEMDRLGYGPARVKTETLVRYVEPIAENHIVFVELRASEKDTTVLLTRPANDADGVNRIAKIKSTLRQLSTRPVSLSSTPAASASSSASPAGSTKPAGSARKPPGPKR